MKKDKSQSWWQGRDQRGQRLNLVRRTEVEDDCLKEGVESLRVGWVVKRREQCPLLPPSIWNSYSPFKDTIWWVTGS